jgi:hypothetical protein
MSILSSLGLFVLAGLCEIGGGYLVWLWFREGRPLTYGIVGAIILVLYGILPTFHRHNLGVSMPRMVECSSYCRCYGVGVLMACAQTDSTSLEPLFVLWA